MKKLLATLLPIVAVSDFVARADLTTNLNAVADAYILELTPDFNTGTETSTIVGEIGPSGADDIRRGLMRFELTGIPAGSTVNSVSLQVKVVKTPSFPVNSTFDVRRLLQSWTELDVTWNSRLPSTAWGQPGAEGGSDCNATASSTVFVTGIGTYTFPSSTALVADVQGWVNSSANNFGWLMVSENESTPRTARHFGTREDAANQPVLTVRYTAPVAPPQLSVSPSSLSFGSVLIGQTNTQSFRVVNTGGLTLTGSVSASAPFAIVSGTPLNVAPGQTGTVAVSFAPGTAASFSNVVLFTSNGGNSSNTVTGSGFAPLPAPPVITNLAVAANLFQFSFNVESNRTYTVQYASASDSGIWLILTNLPAQPAASSLSVTDSITADIRLYRIKTP